MSEHRTVQKVTLEIELVTSDLGPWVELVLVHENGKRRGILSEPINYNDRRGNESAAWGIVSERLSHALREVE